MPVYNNLKAIRRLTNSSLTSVIDITNLNFRSLSDGTLEFLNNIKYDESLNSFSVYKGTFDLVDITDTLTFYLDGVPTFTIDSLGRAEGQELLVKVAETKRLRLKDFLPGELFNGGNPFDGIPGEIIYTGIQNQWPQFGEDFIGFLQGRGWVSLTDGVGTGYITLTELTGSPPVPPLPSPNQGIIWIGSPGYENTYQPTSQTVYYTDENGQIFDILADPNWLTLGNDTKFKRTGKVVVGDTANPRQIQIVDGNQAAGYVLMSDAFGNASWQPSSGGIAPGGGSPCSFVYVANFVANVPTSIPHNLGSTNIVVQLIDTAGTDSLIDGYVDNYTNNSIDVTLSQTINNIKVIIINPGCIGTTKVIEDEGIVVEPNASTLNFVGNGVTASSASPGVVDIDIPGAIGTKKYIQAGETITVPADYQYWIYGNLTVEGTLNNSGEVVIANGNLNVIGGGVYNDNAGAGTLTLVNLSNGVSMQATVVSFTTLVANTPVTVTHNFNTQDFTFNARNGLTLIDIDLQIIDNNSVSVSTTTPTSGTITFIAEI